jgi:hypothetical protein
MGWILQRAGADAQDIPLWLAQNFPRLNFFTASANLERLVEDQISPPAL